MEGCRSVAVRLELSSLFPTLLQLSTKGKGSCGNQDSRVMVLGLC